MPTVYGVLYSTLKSLIDKYCANIVMINLERQDSVHVKLFFFFLGQNLH